MEDIETGLEDLVAVINKYHIRSIAIPPLGSGLGGLNWKAVRQMITKALSSCKNVEMTIYKPKGAPTAKKMGNQ